uniref:Uncharacterized protein n=1 Tax=Anopheles farauti TaxID=69004 RepID=A0A182QJD0_9DIPT
MSNVECGNSSSKSVLKKLLLSEEGPHRSDEEFGLLRGETIEPIEAPPAGPPPMPVPPPPVAIPSPAPPGPNTMLPPPGPPRVPPVIPPPPPEGPPSMPCVGPAVPLPPPFSTLDISGPPILLTPCTAMMKSDSFGFVQRKSFDCVFTCTYTSGPPRRRR